MSQGQTSRISSEDEKKLWSNIERRSDEECWPWITGLDPGGYGRIKIGERRLAGHRLVYELLIGPIEHGMILGHKCDRNNCCNPRHLIKMTRKEGAAWSNLKRNR
jgi:HNH endonuclease